jgi:DNA-binding response OmpR family regulator
MLNETLATENAKLRDEVAYLREELRQRDHVLEKEAIAIKRATGISLAQSRILILLVSRPVTTRQIIARNCCRKEGWEERNADSQVKRLRQALIKHNIQIRTLYGVGWCLDTVNRNRARALLKGALQ